jgi:hypothetical protein
MIKTITALCGIVGFIMLAFIGVFVLLAFSKNEFFLTDDGRESSYFKKLGMVHYRSGTNAFSLIYNSIHADTKTFKPISSFAGKDKRFVYYMKTKQPHVDYATFEVTQEGIIRDKNFVYDNYNNSELVKIIDGANPETYRKILYGLGKDNKNIFYFLKKQPQVDYETFEILFENVETMSGTYKSIKTIRDKNREYKMDYENQMLVPK